jgi:Fe-S-cluster-containing dehydrogenase component
MAKRLFIDLYKCDKCVECAVKCAYLYQPRVTDHGVAALREEATYALVCRRCEEPSCVAACRFEALERREDGVLVRHNMRCVSCKCCSQACPFGTIYPELVPFYAVRCDYCLQKLSEGDPSCVSTCPEKAIEYRDVEESEKDGVYIVSDLLAVRAPKWDKQKV